ncbi:hypothetical protein F2P44_05965 [Massilia sp. CCM 8695]|uniref:Phage tail protein n=1 Tax=Massilia frigida TaxID=2609281 RepID=A0ABX0N0P4_9BURK|nr:hypothetical protein [Massilia frigida]NHZ78826.1 hypothetical protein [Massilia frigida]
MTPIDAQRALFYGKRSRTLVTQTFTSSGTWYAPLTTTRLESLTGKGGDGVPGGGSYRTDPNSIVAIVQTTSGSGPTAGIARWEQLAPYANAAVNALNAGNSTYSGVAISQWTTPGFSYGIYPGTVITVTEPVIPGSAVWTASGSASSSGPISSNGGLTLRWETPYPATTGQATVAFGISFPGGLGGGANPVVYGAMGVSPGYGYAFTVPPGGSISFTYYF